MGILPSPRAYFIPERQFPLPLVVTISVDKNSVLMIRIHIMQSHESVGCFSGVKNIAGGIYPTGVKPICVLSTVDSAFTSGQRIIILIQLSTHKKFFTTCVVVAIVCVDKKTHSVFTGCQIVYCHPRIRIFPTPSSNDISAGNLGSPKLITIFIYASLKMMVHV